MIKWFTIPDFGDEENNTRAFQLTVLILLINITLFIDHSILMFTHSHLYLRWILSFAFVISTSIFLFSFIKKGQSLAASYMFVAFCWMINFGLVWTAGGIRSTENNNFVFIIFFSGYLLGIKPGIYITGLTCAAEFFLVYSEKNGFLPQTSVRYEGYSLLLEYVLFLCIIAFIHYIFTKKIQRSLLKATTELKERVKIETQLNNSNSLLLKAQRIARIGTFEFDLVKDKWNCSENLYEMLGIFEDSPHNFNSWFDVVHPDDKPKVLNYYLKKVFEEKSSLEKAYRIIRPADKKVMWILGIGEVECDELGNPVRLIGIIQDISEIKNAETEMIKLSEAIKQSPVSIVISDTTGKIEYVNPYFSKVSGYSFEEMLGKYAEVSPADFHDSKEYDILYENLLSGKSWHGEYQSKKKNGELYWESVSISPLFDTNGKITNYIAVKEHITEKKRLASDLELALAKSEESDRLKSSLMSNMSHEFRTPMNGILGLAAILKEINTDPRQQKMLDGIVQSGKRLMNTLDAILELANLESDLTSCKISLININEIAQKVIYDYKEKAKSKNLELKYEVCPSPAFVKSTEKNVMQIFHQLLDNAIKFTKDGTIFVKIICQSMEDQSKAIISVKDTGIGISAEHQALIFEEFRQVSEGLSRNYEGSGLGLTLVKRITDSLNGEIQVESVINEGTTFIIEIPIEIQNLPEIAPEHEQTVIYKVPDSSMTEPLIPTLLVEDNPWNLDVTVNYLAGICKIDYAEDGLKAIELVSLKQYGLILMDINLGLGMNGIEATKEIRKLETYKTIPIVALTGFSTDEDKERFLSEGLSHFLSKPFERDQIVNTVKEIINSK